MGLAQTRRLPGASQRAHGGCGGRTHRLLPTSLSCARRSVPQAPRVLLRSPPAPPASAPAGSSTALASLLCCLEEPPWPPGGSARCPPPIQPPEHPVPAGAHSALHSPRGLDDPRPAGAGHHSPSLPGSFPDTCPLPRLAGTCSGCLVAPTSCRIPSAPAQCPLHGLEGTFLVCGRC